MNDTLQPFQKRAEEISRQLQALIEELRPVLDTYDSHDLYLAESDLYDAVDCLADFQDNCQLAAQAPTKPPTKPA